MKKFKLLITTIIISSFAFFSACNKKDLNPNRPTDAEGKRRQNIEEGRGASIGGIIRGVRETILSLVVLILWESVS